MLVQYLPALIHQFAVAQNSFGLCHLELLYDIMSDILCVMRCVVRNVLSLICTGEQREMIGAWSAEVHCPCFVLRHQSAVSSWRI